MGYLSLGSFANVIEKNSSLTKTATIDLILNAIIPDSSESVDPADKSRAFNSHKNIQYIRDAALEIGVKNSIREYVENNIIPKLSYIAINETIELLKALIMGDITIVDKDKEYLLEKAYKEHLAEFISRVLLFACTRNNDLKIQNNLPTPLKDDSIMVCQGKIFLNGEELILPDKLLPPQNFKNEEATYLAELLKVYAEKQKVSSFTVDNLPPKYQEELKRHRQDFYSAEAVRRKLREISITNNEFETLENDTYDGIIDTHSMSYNNGYERLLHVLQQAVSLSSGKSLLWELPKWIGASEKKGVCHILVNDKRMKWVIDDE